jgi:hypothetical protein
MRNNNGLGLFSGPQTQTPQDSPPREKKMILQDHQCRSDGKGQSKTFPAAQVNDI